MGLNRGLLLKNDCLNSLLVSSLTVRVRCWVANLLAFYHYVLFSDGYGQDCGFSEMRDVYFQMATARTVC